MSDEIDSTVDYTRNGQSIFASDLSCGSGEGWRWIGFELWVLGGRIRFVGVMGVALMGGEVEKG